MAGGRPAAIAIGGGVDEGYGAVADEFRANFRVRREVGAACAVVRGGRLVVDLWGGFCDRRRTRPWQRDTLVSVFSTTKGMASMAMAVAHARGLFALDEPVATYWPEFAQHGKQDIAVRCLLAHQAGLAVIDDPIDVDLLHDLDGLGRLLAAQRTHWEPGTHHGYHGQSLGWYESQLLQRVDPDGRTVGRFFAEEVAEPLGIEFYIGLPDSVGDDRLATFIGGGPARAALHVHQMPPRLVVALCNPRSPTGRVFRNPKVLARAADINRRELLRLELPSVNGVGHARAIATAYGAFACGAPQLALDQRTTDALEAPPRAPTHGSRDLILRVDTAYSCGFMKPFPILPFGTSDRAFGHTGTGGSFGYADPDRELGYAYVMNRAGFGVPTDRRELALRAALATSLP